jgi:hypothetical protein
MYNLWGYYNMKYKEFVPAFLRNVLGSIFRTNEFGSREC